MDNGHFVSGISYNQPEIYPSALWNSNAITFANSSILGTQSSNIFVDVTNAIYVSSLLHAVRMWSAADVNPRRNLSTLSGSSRSVFVTGNGDIYAGSGSDGQVVKWRLNDTNATLVMTASGSCSSLFFDINSTLYCAIETQHKIVKRFLGNNNTTALPIVAGNGLAGSLSTMLNVPRGIFVSRSFNLYVADSGNDRVQLFPFGQLNATTIVGSGAPGTITLDCPTAVILDANENLFIADGNNHRIIGSGPNGFQCVVGCTGVGGPASDQLLNPQSLAFDSLGNLFVLDKNNNRIQKFLLATRYCSKYS